MVDVGVLWLSEKRTQLTELTFSNMKARKLESPVRNDGARYSLWRVLCALIASPKDRNVERCMWPWWSKQNPIVL